MILWNNPLDPLPQAQMKADQIEVLGEGLIKGETGCNMYFQIKPKDIRVDERLQFSATHCQVTFEGPSKPNIKFRTGENNIVNCAWVAYLPGSYKIIIRYDGEEINGSPFVCNVIESEHGRQIFRNQLRRIVCSGQGLQSGIVNESNEVKVSEINGMIGGLRVAMEGPGKSVISFKTNTDESLSMFYQVPNPGDYSLIIKFMDSHVNGSPFKINVK